MINELSQIEPLTWLIGAVIVLAVSLFGAFYMAIVNAPYIEGEDDEISN